MLPQPSSPEFPSELKAARERKGLNFTQLAKLCDISPVMPARYEDINHSNFGPPSHKTWQKLNQVLYPETSNATITIKSEKLLSEASIDELIQALKDRGAQSVALTF